MIMIDHGSCLAGPRLTGMREYSPAPCPGAHWIPKTDENVYIFRDSSGKIIYAYNNKLSIASLQKIFGSVPVSKPPTVMSHAYPVRMPVDFGINISNLHFPRTRTTHMGALSCIHPCLLSKGILPRQQGHQQISGSSIHWAGWSFPMNLMWLKRPVPFLV